MAVKHFKKLAFGLVLIAISITLYAFFWPEQEVEYITEPAELRDIDQIVEVNGTVESNSKIDLRFQTPGQIAKVNFQIGDPVFEGDVLAELENEKAQVEIDKAQANLDMAEAELNLQYAGPSYEEILVSSARIDEAEINLKNAEETYEDVLLANQEKLRQAKLNVSTAEINLDAAEKNKDNVTETGSTTDLLSEKQLNDSYSNAPNSIQGSIDSMQNALNAADQILGIDDKDANNSFEDELGGYDPLNKIRAEQSYKDSKEALNDFKSSFEEFEMNAFLTEDERNQQIDSLLIQTKNTLNDVRDTLDKTYTAIENTRTINGVTSDLLTTLKAKITPQQDAINSKISVIDTLIQTIDTLKLEIAKTQLGSSGSLNTATSSYEKAVNDLEIAESNLKTVEVQNEIDENSAKRQIDLMEVALTQANANHANLIADPRYVDVAGTQAKVDSYAAGLRQANLLMKDSQIIAPLDSLITDILADIGENVSTTEVIIVLMTDSMQIKANVSESDINKLHVGDDVTMTFDALSLTEIFNGKVVSINPAETIVDGVIYYETTIALSEKDDRIRSGMTSDLEIHTEKRENVLTVNSIATEYDEGKTYVYVLENGAKVRKEVRLGIEGETYVEVLDGLNEGENIIIYEK